MNRNKNSVGINTFVRRQIKASGKTYSKLSFTEIAKHAQKRLEDGIYKKGYRDGVILIPVSSKLINNFICPIVKVTSNTRIESIVKRNNQKTAKENGLYQLRKKYNVVINRGFYSD
mgnify:CR=1 FL=1